VYFDSTEYFNVFVTVDYYFAYALSPYFAHRIHLFILLHNIFVEQSENSFLLLHATEEFVARFFPTQKLN